jgi:hypothetical protein
MRTEDAETLLLRFPNAFLLLTLIALRARRAGDKCKWTGLGRGQAMVGDHESCGLSRQEYRTAQANLQSLSLATFKPTSKGTIATICGADVYDINADGDNHQSNQTATINQPSTNHRPTTNKNVKKDKNENNIYVGASADTPSANKDSQIREFDFVEEVGTLPPSPRSEAPPPAKIPRKAPPKKPAFVPPSLEEVLAYVETRVKEGAARINAKKFFIHYDSNGWKVGKKHVDWKTKVKMWECDAGNLGQPEQPKKKRVWSTVSRTPEQIAEWEAGHEDRANKMREENRIENEKRMKAEAERKKAALKQTEGEFKW